MPTGSLPSRTLQTGLKVGPRVGGGEWGDRVPENTNA